MKVSYNQLQKLINFSQTPEELGQLLTGTGLEVEATEKIEAVKGGFEGLVIGEVKSCQKHPDADKLSLTKVDIGTDSLLDIVCGAPNVAAGQKVVVATVGTTLYPSSGEAFSIKKSKIRGAVSEGMLCAEDEIGIGNSHAGIIVLDTELPLGSPISKYYNLEPDYQIEIGLTPNRADAASHLGVARDISAIMGKEINRPAVSAFKTGSIKSSINVKVENHEACPRFCGLEIRGIEVKESPEWLKSFLKTIAVKSINNIVDITNYINHFLGQPMHIFDADEIVGNQIIVKIPEKDTEVITLDGISRKLSGFDLAICNAQEPMAMAGVFGGEKSGAKAETKNIFLEVAYFEPSQIRKTSTFHSLKTDASFRYERGTDPNLPPYAIKVAALLILELAGGEICDSLIDLYPNPIKKFEIDLKFKNINRLIGKTLDQELIVSILQSLEIEILEKTAETLKVSVPPYRVDVTREADVIEEILRIYGFDNIELSAHLSSDFIAEFPVKDAEMLNFSLGESLAAMGFNEIQTLSIVKPSDNEMVKNEELDVVKLLNPLSEDLSQMRQSLLFSGLNAMVYNINRRNKDLKFFEFGRIYGKTQGDKAKYKEKKILALWMTGKISAESWAEKAQNVEFKQLNQTVQAVLEGMKFNKIESATTENEIFEYGLEIKVRNKVLVSFGKVNAIFCKKADLKQAAFYAEFDWDYLMKLYTAEIQFIEIPKFPEVRRDLSLVLAKSIKFEKIKQLAFHTEKKLLKAINVFDVYEGDKLENDQKSYSVSFILQDTEKTLNDAQIDKTMQRLMSVFETELPAIIRK